jgi:hypothetical protein
VVGTQRRCVVTRERNFMLDIVFIAATVLFFAVSIGYVYFCEKVR